MLATLDATRPRVSVDRTAPFLWYTLCVIPQSQARVCQRARELGIETYAPMSRTPPQLRKFGRSRVTEAEVRPLMPGYVFVAMPRRDAPFGLFDPRYGSDALRGSLGFISCEQGVDADRWPMPVREAVIADMRLREAHGEFDFTGMTDDGRHRVAKWIKRAIVEKLPVLCTSGPFAQFFGRVVKIKKTTLITVEVGIFGRFSLIDMPVEWVRLVA